MSAGTAKVAGRRGWAWQCEAALLLVASALAWALLSHPTCSAWLRGRAGAKESARPQLRKIQDVRVGDRVRVDEEVGEHDLSLGEEVDPASWRLLELRATKKDGSWAEVVLLRPDVWVEERGARAGQDADLGPGVRHRRRGRGAGRAAVPADQAGQRARGHGHVQTHRGGGGGSVRGRAGGGGDDGQPPVLVGGPAGVRAGRRTASRRAAARGGRAQTGGAGGAARVAPTRVQPGSGAGPRLPGLRVGAAGPQRGAGGLPARSEDVEPRGTFSTTAGGTFPTSAGGACDPCESWNARIATQSSDESQPGPYLGH